MEKEENKGQAMENQQNETAGKPSRMVIILLSVAVVVSFALLGVYIWTSSKAEPVDTGQSITTTPGSETAYATVSPTNSPAPAETTKPTETSTPTPEPTQSPSPTEIPATKPRAQVTPMPKLPFEPVKALYLNPGTVQDNEKMNHYIDLANRTEINAYVIDIKSDYGTIMYKSEIEDVLKAGACMGSFDIRKVNQKLHDNNIRVIGRIVTFKDSQITKYRTDLAIQHNGSIFKQPDSGGNVSYWLDATNPGSWEYVTSVVEEAINFGFDEIQFDYVRFPETSLYEYELQNLEEGKERHDYIEGFLEYVRQRVPEGTILSADVFGMPLISARDYGEIGQTLETIGKDLDYISPMIYPSHFANDAPKGKSMANGVGQTINGVKFTHPDLQPYEVIYNTLMVGKKRIEAIDGYKLKCRPYIQGFTATFLPTGYWIEYGVNEHRAQIQAVYDAGYEEWIFWNAGNEYVEDAFLPETE